MNRALRDLHWAIRSPSLLVDDPPLRPELQRAIESFDASGIDGASLTAFLSSSPTQRVGHYFERLILYWLDQVCGFQIVAHGFQVRDEQRTIGEIDFLFRDSTRQLHHWETAVKFYLHRSQPSANCDQLIGPNAVDSLAKKLARIYKHQLPLSKRILDEPVCRHAFVKGRIFYHPLSSNKNLGSVSSSLSSSHLRAIWIRASELDWFDRQPTSNRYRFLNKPHWLAPERAPVSSAGCLAAEAMQELLSSHFQQHSQPKLCSVLTACGEYYEEIERLFVVSTHWPALSGRPL